MKLSVSAVVDEFRGAQLGDVRRNTRLSWIAKQFAMQPGESIPKMAGDEVGLEAVYRFLGNPGISWLDVLAPHTRRTRERSGVSSEVFVLHDTTTFQFNHGDPDEIGWLPTGKPGFLGHVSLVVSADGERRPLGIAHLEPIFREARSKRPRAQKQSGNESTQREDREALRWNRGVLASTALLAPVTQCIHIMDREGDSFALLADISSYCARFVVRMRHNRVARSLDEGSPWSKVRPLLEKPEATLEREVPLAKRVAKTAPRSKQPARDARLATLHMAATSIEIKSPNYLNDTPALAVNVVRVFEPSPPVDQEPIEWLLMTTEPVSTPAEIARVVDAYRTRWVIEEFFKALKSGCVYEERRLESRTGLLNALALFVPIACEMLWMRSRARNAPTAPASEVLSARQITILRAMLRKPLPEEPSARDVLLAIAGLGGHLKRNGEPGWSTIRHGYERLLTAEIGWVARSQ